MKSNDFCDYSKKHFGDDHVFPYLGGEVIMCDNYSCSNHGGERMRLEGDNDVGICLTHRLKKCVETSKLIRRIIDGVINHKKNSVKLQPA